MVDYNCMERYEKEIYRKTKELMKTGCYKLQCDIAMYVSDKKERIEKYRAVPIFIIPLSIPNAIKELSNMDDVLKSSFGIVITHEYVYTLDNSYSNPMNEIKKISKGYSITYSYPDLIPKEIKNPGLFIIRIFYTNGTRLYGLMLAPSCYNDVEGGINKADTDKAINDYKNSIFNSHLWS